MGLLLELMPVCTCFAYKLQNEVFTVPPPEAK